MEHQGLLERLINSPANYWASFVCDGLAATLLLAYGVTHTATRPIVPVALGLAGFLAWGLVEYVLHRWILHGPPSLAKRSHTRHHREAEELIGTPILVIAAGATVVWGLLSLAMPAGPAALTVFGLYLGYIYYQLIHHAHHHWDLRLGYFVRLRAYHDIHHRRFLVNYGSTTTLWDKVFGTFQPLDKPAR